MKDPLGNGTGLRVEQPADVPVSCARVEYFRRIFPSPYSALESGVVCQGGDLVPERILAAYTKGLFPWYNEGSPILWWSLDPRCIVPLETFHLPRRSIRSIRRAGFTLTFDAAFVDVVRACAAPRAGEDRTWILPEMITAYRSLHTLGYAHSVETWQGRELVGGLYGVGLGRAFFGESMFHLVSEASRYALSGLVALLRMRGVTLLDSQQETPHMMRMGATCIPRRSYMALLRESGLGLQGTVSDMDLRPWRERYAWDSESSSWSVKSK